MKKGEKNEHVVLDPNVNDVTKTVIGCAYTVSNSLGCGFLEKVYENALVHELAKHGLKIEDNMPLRYSMMTLMLATTLPI